MSKNLTLNLNATEIKHAVKSDTYITGQIDKSADMVKNAALAFNEQAGDESYHERKLFRTMKGALAKFESAVAEYIETSDANAFISDTLTQDSVTFTVTLVVGSRTSGAFANTLSYLAQEFIINTMLYYWWQPIKPSLAKDYVAFASENLLDVKRCLAKSAPTAAQISYSDISGYIQSQSAIAFPLNEYSIKTGQTFIEPTPEVYPMGATLTYTSSNTNVATVDEETGEVTILSVGDTVITASISSNPYYTSAQASYTLHVTAS